MNWIPNEIDDVKDLNIKEALIFIFNFVSRVEEDLNQVIDLIPMKYKRGTSKDGNGLFVKRNMNTISKDEIDKAKSRMADLLKSIPIE